MKKLFILLLSGLMFMTSCKDEEKAPIITFDQAGKGAYVRLLQVNEGVDGYNLSQFSSSAYDFDVEFVDVQQGDLVSTYTIYVSFAPSPFSPTPAKSEVLYFTADASSFGESERGYKTTNVRIPLSDVASKLGLSEGDLGGADSFNFRSEIVLTDGSVFQGSNSTAAVNGSAFAGHFNFSVKLSCPLSSSAFVGAYTLTHETGLDPAFGVYPFGGDGITVNLAEVSGTKRSFDAVYIAELGIGQPAMTFVFDIVCSIVVPDSGQGTGLGCGGTIRLGPQASSFGEVDVTDDSTFKIDILDWADDGGCGVPANPITIRLDKQ